MSKRRNKRQLEGTIGLIPETGESPAAMHDAQPPVAAAGDQVVSDDAKDPGPPPASAVAPQPVVSGTIDMKQPLVDAGAAEARAVTQARPAAAPIEASHGTLGQRLRAARELRGWSAEEVAAKLRFPAQIVQKLEAEQFEKIGYGIYLRGYLMNYARLVGVPTILIEPVLRERTAEPPLVSSGTISHSRYLYQRYSVSALYLILTAVIIVPAVMLAMRASQEPGSVQLTALSTSAGPQAEPETATPTSTGDAAQTTPVTASAAAAASNGAPSDSPLVASLAPFPLARKENSPGHETIAAGSGAHTLKLSLKQASWVEVIAVGGDKLEYGLLPGGSVRSYSSDKVLEVRLGNCEGAEVEADGQPQDLTPFRHANVAHFRLFSKGEAISRTDS